MTADAVRCARDFCVMLYGERSWEPIRRSLLGADVIRRNLRRPNTILTIRRYVDGTHAQDNSTERDVTLDSPKPCSLEGRAVKQLFATCCALSIAWTVGCAPSSPTKSPTTSNSSKSSAPSQAVTDTTTPAATNSTA